MKRLFVGLGLLASISTTYAQLNNKEKVSFRLNVIEAIDPESKNYKVVISDKEVKAILTSTNPACLRPELDFKRQQVVSMAPRIKKIKADVGDRVTDHQIFLIGSLFQSSGFCEYRLFNIANPVVLHLTVLREGRTQTHLAAILRPSESGQAKFNYRCKLLAEPSYSGQEFSCLDEDGREGETGAWMYLDVPTNYQGEIELNLRMDYSK